MYEFGVEERAAAERVLASRNLFRYMDEAREADEFEIELAGKLGTTHALATSSGTGALICGLSALGVGPGDEVLIPAYAYVADVLAVLAVGAVPVVCEIDESLSLDAADITDKVTPRTRAVIPVHMCGFPSDMAGIVAAANEYGLVVLEDACQAIGGTYRGERLGTIGTAGAYSFNQAKIITAGEGGALVTSDAHLHDRAFMMHDASAVYDGRRFDSPVFAGLAFRMNEITAAVLRVQLTRLDGIITRLRAVRDRIESVLRPVAGLSLLRPSDPEGACGTNTAVVLPDADAARNFCKLVTEVPDVWAFQGMALGHSFFEWDLLHQRRGGHHPARNPLAGWEGVQGPDELPRSRDFLSRVVILGHPIDLAGSTVDKLGHVVARG
jgi:dTDP-4-amino-4,6-dideoxygalactose transaminase